MESFNFLGVIVATVGAFLIGWIWYGPLFGKKWIELMGFTPKSMQNMKIKPVQAMIGGFIANFVVASVLSVAISLSGFYYPSVSPVVCALQTGFILWLGFIATNTLGSVLWEGRTLRLWCFNNTYNLLVILVMSFIISILS